MWIIAPRFIKVTITPYVYIVRFDIKFRNLIKEYYGLKKIYIIGDLNGLGHLPEFATRFLVGKFW